MKHKIFIRYFVFFFVVILLAFGFLVAFTTASTTDYVAGVRRERMENEVWDLAETVTGLMVAGEVDFDNLIAGQADLLRSIFRTRAEREGLLLFMVDSGGKILVSSDANAAAPSRVLPEDFLNEALQKSRTGEFFQSLSGTFLPENATVRAVTLEQTGDTSGRSRVLALVFALMPESGSDGFFTRILKRFLAASILVLLITFLCFLYLSNAFLLPVRQLSAAAERYAKGDFSVKLPEKGNGEMDALMVTFNEMASRLERNEKNRQTFVANVSHDLRTPMTTIGGYVQNMLEGAISAEEQDHYLRIILDEVQRLSRLVGTLLETSRMTAGERQYVKEPMDLCELSRVTLLSFEKRLEEMRANVQFDAEPYRIRVTADKDAIHQVIYNLIDNAIKFSPSGGTVSIRIREQNGKAVFSIRNSGEGIKAGDLPNLFDRFYKSDHSRGLDKQGVGLGLFIAKSIIDAHGEEIWVTSKEGAWAQFVFTLPLTK